MIKAAITPFIYVLLFLITSYLFGVTFGQSIIFLFYNIFYLIIPGYLVYSYLCNEIKQTNSHVVFIWVLGCFVNITIILISLIINIKQIIFLYPVIFIPFVLHMVRKGEVLKLNFQSNQNEFNIIIVFSFFLAFSCELFNFRETIEQHMLWVNAYSNSLASGHPFEDPFIHGVPLNYHYFFNLYIVGVHEVINIPLELVSSRLSIHLYLVLFFIFLGAFLKELSGSLLVSLIVITQLYLTFGYSNIMWELFHSATASIMMRIPSVILSFHIFVAFSWLLFRCINIKAITCKGYMFFLIIVALAIGSRANLLPVIMCALALVIVYRLFNRQKYGNILAIFMMCVLITIIGGYGIYGFGSESSGADIIKLNPLNESVTHIGKDYGSPLYGKILQLFINEKISVLIYLFLLLIGRLGFLIVGLVLYFFSKKSLVSKEKLLYLLGIYFAGLGAIVIVENYTQEQWAFFWYGDIAIACIACIGLASFFNDKKWVSCRKYVIFFSLTLAMIQVYDYVQSFSNNKNDISFPQSSPVFHNNVLIRDIIVFFRENDTGGRKRIIYTASSDFLGSGNSLARIFPSLLPNTYLLANDRMARIFNQNSRSFLLKEWVAESMKLSSVTEKAISAAQFYDENTDLFIISSSRDIISDRCIPKVFSHSLVSIYKIDYINCTYNEKDKKLYRNDIHPSFSLL